MDEQAEREATIARVQNELTTLSRRGSARARRAYSALSLVDQSLVTYIGSNPGCRNVDIAAHFQLNKSTVSRQVGSLIDLGLVRAQGGHEGRGQALVLTETGESLLKALADEVLMMLRIRFDSWSEEDVLTFANLLERFNSDAGAD